MNQPDDESSAEVRLPTEEDYEVGREILRQGRHFPDVRIALRELPLSRESQQLMIERLAGEVVRPLTIAGASSERMLSRLMSRGLDEATAQAACAAGRRSHSIRSRGSGKSSFDLWNLAGAILILLGLFAMLVPQATLLPGGSIAGWLALTVGVFLASLRRFFWRQ